MRQRCGIITQETKYPDGDEVGVALNGRGDTRTRERHAILEGGPRSTAPCPAALQTDHLAQC